MIFNKASFWLLARNIISFILIFLFIRITDYFIAYQLLSLKNPYSILQTCYIAFGALLFQVTYPFLRKIEFKWYIYLLLIAILIIMVEIIDT